MIWNFEHEIWGLKFLQLEILGILNLKIGHLECEIFKLGNENFELKISDLEFKKTWKFWTWSFILNPFQKIFILSFFFFFLKIWFFFF